MADEALTKDELMKIEKDIADARSQLSAKATDLEQAKEVGKREAEKEMKLQQELDSHRKAREELEKKLSENQKALEEQSKKFQDQLDSLKTTKMPITPENPFAAQSSGKATIMSKDEVDAIEDASRRMFFEERGPGGK